MQITLYDQALRTVGIEEIPGPQHHPLIQFGFSLCSGYDGETPDEVPWCSAWLQVPCWWLRLPRSKSASARSWLDVGWAIDLEDARVGYDVVILSRPPNPTAGHVGLYAGLGGTFSQVSLLSGNHQNRVAVAPYPVDRVVGVRRVFQEAA